MNSKSIFFLPLFLIGCATVDTHVSPDASIRRGDTIQIASMSTDPLGGVAALTIALEKRGFVVLDGAVGKSATNTTATGTETFRPTSASHYLTFTYTTISGGRASCRLINIKTKRSDVVVDIKGLTSKSADQCADAILVAASQKP
jgi:hypothetical protein